MGWRWYERSVAKMPAPRMAMPAILLELCEGCLLLRVVQQKQKETHNNMEGTKLVRGSSCY